MQGEVSVNYWTPDEESLLRERYGKARTRDLAAALGRSMLAVKQKAMKLGLDAGRAHTDEEIDAVRSLYADRTAIEIAERLYGTAEKVNRVNRLVVKLGLKKWPSWPDDVLDRVRALHAEGLTDSGIAGRMAGVFAAGVAGRLQVRHVRLRLGLPANRGTEAYRAARRAGVRRQHATLGIDNPNDLRRRAHRRFAERYNLPPDLRPAQVRMVLALTGGPLTLPELKAAIGVRPGAGLLHNAARTTYQADLCNRGLLARIPTGIGGSARGPRVRYVLTVAALDMLAANAEDSPR
jgi:hypothetical protein